MPLVIARAHDCITLFLGDRARYASEAKAHPGTFWYVQDYLERADDGPFAGLGPPPTATPGPRRGVRPAVGPDNADYLMEVMGAWRDHYDRAAFVDLGVADASPTRERARVEAASRDWSFAPIEGSIVLVRRLIEGDWAHATS